MIGFDTTPRPAFLRAMQAQRWTVQGALSELVDNSFGAGRGNARNVLIGHHTKQRILTVLDDGQGMEAIGRLFQLGNTIGRAPGDIGVYGAGGTMALLWLASKVEIWTLRDGKVSADAVDWREQIQRELFPVVSNDWHPATLSNVPQALLNNGHGTLIRIHLQRERIFVPSNVKRDLARTYAPALRHGKTLRWVTRGGKEGGTDLLADPYVDAFDESVIIDGALVVPDNEEPLMFHGRVGVIDGLPLSQSDIAIGYGPRVIIRTKDCYKSPDGETRYSGAGISGWIDLGDGWQSYLSVTKDAMNDRPLWEAFMAHVHEEIRPLLKAAEDEKLSVELEGIALMLEQIFDGQATVEVGSLGKKPPGEEEKGGQRHGTDEPDRGEEPTRDTNKDPTDKDGDDTTRDDPARTRIEIISEDDVSMGGVLCRAELLGERIDVFVNKDHEDIQTAMMRKPVNRQFLNFVVVSDIANVIVKNDILLRKLLPKTVMRDLMDRDDEERRRLLIRVLVDSTKRVA